MLRPQGTLPGLRDGGAPGAGGFSHGLGGSECSPAAAQRNCKGVNVFGTAKSLYLSEAAWEWQSREKCSLALMKASRAGTVFSCGLVKNTGLGVN